MEIGGIRRGDIRPRKCFSCNQPDHMPYQCPTVRRYRCIGRGHLTRECIEPLCSSLKADVGYRRNRDWSLPKYIELGVFLRVDRKPAYSFWDLGVTAATETINDMMGEKGYRNESRDTDKPYSPSTSRPTPPTFPNPSTSSAAPNRVPPNETTNSVNMSSTTATQGVKVLHSIGRPVRLGPDAVCIWFGIGPYIWGPFSLQTDPSDTRSWITSGPVNGAEPVFPETATILCSQLQKKVNSLFNSFTSGCLSFQCNFVLLIEWIALQTV